MTDQYHKNEILFGGYNASYVQDGNKVHWFDTNDENKWQVSLTGSYYDMQKVMHGGPKNAIFDTSSYFI